MDLEAVLVRLGVSLEHLAVDSLQLGKTPVGVAKHELDATVVLVRRVSGIEFIPGEIIQDARTSLGTDSRLLRASGPVNSAQEPNEGKVLPLISALEIMWYAGCGRGEPRYPYRSRYQH